MILRSCYIENFGKISELRVDFHDGINVIKEPNAWGKSTLAAFIKVMFFGFDSRKEPGAFEKERTRYRPWQGGVYGGELDFTLGSRTYRISRTFGKTEKSDEFHIYDLSTNLESVDFSSNIGEEIFDLDSASFKRSIFIAQNDCESHTSDAINAKLGNLAENTNDINNYETAKERLKSAANQLSPNRSTGSLKKRRNHLTELEEDLKSFDAADAAMAELNSLLKDSEKKKEELSQQRDFYVKELRRASEESRRSEQKKIYQSLCEDYEEKQEVAAAIEELFPNGIPEEEELNARAKTARRLEEDLALLKHSQMTVGDMEEHSRLSEMFSGSIPTGESIDETLKKWSEVPRMREERTRLLTQLTEREKTAPQEESFPKEKAKKTNSLMNLGIILEILGLAVVILGFVLRKKFVYSDFLPFLGIGLLVIATILVFDGIHKKRQSEKEIYVRQLEWKKDRHTMEKDIHDLQRQSSETEERIREITAGTKAFLEGYRIFCDADQYAQMLFELKGNVQEYKSLAKRQEVCEEASKRCKEQRAALDSFGRTYGLMFGDDIAGDITLLQTESARARLALAEAQKAKRRKEAFEAETNVEELFEVSQDADSLEEINRQIHVLDEEVEKVRKGIELYSRQMEDLQEQMDLRDEKEQELNDNRILQEEETRKYGIVMLTQEYLQRAKEQFTARYMEPLSNAFRKYYRLLAGSEEDDWMIDANISVRRKEQGELRETKWLSAGYQDLLGICMRLALVDAMYQEEKPFLVLDDPFVNLDEEKTAHGMELLKKVAEEYQTIYFTCHQSRQPGIE